MGFPQGLKVVFYAAYINKGLPPSNYSFGLTFRRERLSHCSNNAEISVTKTTQRPYSIYLSMACRRPFHKPWHERQHALVWDTVGDGTSSIASLDATVVLRPSTIVSVTVHQRLVARYPLRPCLIRTSTRTVRDEIGVFGNVCGLAWFERNGLQITRSNFYPWYAAIWSRDYKGMGKIVTMAFLLWLRIWQWQATEWRVVLFAQPLPPSNTEILVNCYRNKSLLPYREVTH